MQKRYFRTTQKFGIEIPKTVKRALEIDGETGTTFWQDAIKKEMGTVMKAFEILPDGTNAPVGYSEIKCGLKMEDFLSDQFEGLGLKIDLLFMIHDKSVCTVMVSHL